MEKPKNLYTEVTSKFLVTKTIDYLWIIDGFSTLSKDTYKSSPTFPSSEDNNTWTIDVKLDKNDPNELSMFLHPAKTYNQDSIIVSFSFNVLNSNYTKVLSRKLDHAFEKPFEYFGFRGFFYVCELEQYVENDELKLQIILELKFPFNSSCEIQFDNDNPIAGLANSFQSMLSCHDFSDFFIKVDNEEIAVHKVILAARSPVFNAMLKNDLLEAKTGFVNITDISKGTISALIQFIYTSKVDVNSRDDAKNLFLAADKYDLPDLKRLCENYLIRNCTVMNAADTLVFAEQKNTEYLKQAIMDYITENKRLFKNLKSLKLSDPHQNLMKDLISEVLQE